MRKGQGDGDWEPTALELSGKLGRANRKIKALQAQVKKLEEQQKLSQEPPPPRPPTPPPRSPGPLWSSPITGPPDPPPSGSIVSCAGSLWVGWEANRARFESKEVEREKQENRTRGRDVRKAFGWVAGEEDPVLFLAAKGFWKGAELKGIGPEAGVALHLFLLLFTSQHNHPFEHNAAPHKQLKQTLGARTWRGHTRNKAGARSCWTAEE